tara:strand:- start:8754 stop:9341 length:588 start_codon:yes stop_codon:yes gene_type:complete
MISLNIFTKCPYSGGPKKRLSDFLTSDERSYISEQMLNNILLESKKVFNIKRFLWVYPNFYNKFFNNIEKEYSLSLKNQIGNSLYERMEYCLSTQSRKFSKTLLVGSDIPSLSSDIINDAIRILDYKDYVLGPSKDGGFYLLGFKGVYKDIIFKSQNNETILFNYVIENIKNLSSTYGVIPVLKDIDIKEDLLVI